MSLWDVLCVIGALLILNGAFMTQQQIVTEKADRNARRSGAEVLCGNYKGLLWLTNAQIWVHCDAKGELGQAQVVHAGIFRIAKTYTFDLSGYNIETLEPDSLKLPAFAAGACKAAQRNYRNVQAFTHRKQTSGKGRAAV